MNKKNQNVEASFYSARYISKLYSYFFTDDLNYEGLLDKWMFDMIHMIKKKFKIETH